MTDDSAPGWDAIDAALSNVYAEAEPATHMGTAISYALGGPDPIQGISVYRSEAQRPHWHYVTYGFSELYEKETDVPEVSGFGFELTLRLARSADEVEPPIFAFNFLQNLARYVFDSGNAFAAGDHMDANGPIAADQETEITAFCVALDPELPPIDTPNGRVEFLQVVGITADELRSVKCWNTGGFLEVIKECDSHWVTDLSRASALGDKTTAERVREGIDNDGSSTGLLFVRDMRVGKAGLINRRLVWELGAYECTTIASVLPARLRHGRGLHIQGGETAVQFVPASKPSVTTTDDGLKIELSTEALDELVAVLQPKAAEHKLKTVPGLDNRVRKSHITGNDGNVVKVIG